MPVERRPRRTHGRIAPPVHAGTEAADPTAPPDPKEPTGSPVPGAELRAGGVLLRFVSCGLVSLSAGLLWRLTLAPRRLGVASALLGILFLLSGFILGGVLLYIRDARLRVRRPGAVPDERLVFSFVVFAVVPFAVLALVGFVYVLALIVGAS